MIQIENLSKRFGPLVAVDGVSFTARNGEITGLVGPNGAGKTTTLRMLYGLLAADRGRARVDGFDVAQAPREARARLGVLADSPGLYARLSAREHLEYSGRLQGLGGAALARAVERLIEELELETIADRRAAGFSQGERRKVALARALLHDPGNLVLDEPTNGLDVPASRALRRTLRRLAEAGKCVVLSSHILPEVAALCERVVVIARGRVVADAPPAELLSRTGQQDLEEAFIQLVGSEEVAA